MTEAKTITENEWTLLNDSSKNISVFFDDDGDGAVGKADVRIIGSETTPTDSDIDLAKRLIGINRYPMQFSPDGDYTRFYAKCVSGEASIIVTTDGINIAKKTDVFIQDQFTNIVEARFFNKSSECTLTQAVSVDDNSIELEEGHGVTAGDYIVIDRKYKGLVLSVSGQTVNLDEPANIDFGIGTTVEIGSADMNIDGSTAQQTFIFAPPTGVTWDITRMIGAMRDASSMDDGDFGGLTELTNGLVLRVKKGDGTYNNLFCAHTNSDFALTCYDADYIPDTQGPSGEYGFRFRRTFSGQEKNGVVIRLNGDLGEQLEAIVRDDLTGLTFFNMGAQGHVVE